MDVSKFKRWKSALQKLRVERVNDQILQGELTQNIRQWKLLFL